MLPLKSIIKEKLAGVERKWHYPSGSCIYLVLWWLGRRGSKSEVKGHNPGHRVVHVEKR